VDEYVSDDPIWDDLAAIAFELVAKPDRARDFRAEGGARDADYEEGE
jgi:hypothetical protein